MTETNPVPSSRFAFTGGGPGKRPHVAILGFTDHRNLAPFNDPSFEIWGLNELYRYMPVEKFTRWFEIHDRAYFEKNDPDHLKALATLPVPVYMHTAHADIPPAVALPKAEIEAKCGTYMTSSIAWMLGLAILEGFKVIHVYGVDMAQDTEYKEQRPCCEYLIGLARGMGIEVYVPPTSDLMKAVGQYGFGGEGSQFRAKIDERVEWLHRERNNLLQRTVQLDKEFEAKQGGLVAEYNAKKNEWQSSARQLEGAIDDCIYWRRSWSISGDVANAKNPHPDRGESKLPEKSDDGVVRQPVAIAEPVGV